VGYLLGHDYAEWTSLWETLNNIASRLLRTKDSVDGKPSITLQDVGLLVPQLIAGGATLFSLSKGLKAFKIDPAVLLSTTAENFKLKNASAQTSFRSKFAEQFEEVTDALPYTMVIVIDDLDRCQPNTVLTVMEAVNFLVSSGKCFVLFGMATHRVQAALGLVFEKIAGELVDLDVEIPRDAPLEVKERAVRDRRLAYARDYLDKLINLEIVVPKRIDIPPHLLIDTSNIETPKYIANAVGQILEFWPLWLATVTIAMGLLFGIEHTIPKEPQSMVSIQKAPAVIPTAEPAPPSQDERAAPIPTKHQQTSNRYIPAIQFNNLVVVDRWAVGTTLALVIVLAAGLVLYRLRAGSYQVNDSRQFHDALRTWIPVVQQRRGTPRAIKRFGNRLRYLAMLQQDNKIDESGYDELRRRLKALTWGTPKRTDFSGSERTFQNGPAEKQIEEPLLVALASFHEVYGPKWQDRLRPKGKASLEIAVKRAIQSYTATTKTSWPPNSCDLNAFEKLLNGIRVLGKS